jgi:Tol biopolymer transport system component
VRRTRVAAGALLAAAACRAGPQPQSGPAQDPLRDPRETHLRNLRQLSFGGENAEAYFSPDGRKLIFQSSRDGAACDQIFTMDTDGSGVRRVSSGAGRTTCSYFYYPDARRVLYASTHLGGAACPPVPGHERGYVWPIYAEYDIFSAAPDGLDVKQLTFSPGYDAEATFAPDGSRIVFTSVRSGDLELWTMAPDGTDARQLTSAPGYDGGAFYSADSKRIVWRAHRLDPGPDLDEYRALLREALVRPTKLALYVMNADGTGERRVTDGAHADFAPFFHPDGRRIVFASNRADPRGRDFDLYLVADDGAGLERITWAPEFDGFPMFSPDGHQLVFASNRNGKARGETNIFIADWVE